MYSVTKCTIFGLVLHTTCRTSQFSNLQLFIRLMEYITLRLDSTNEVEQWYVRHSTLYQIVSSLVKTSVRRSPDHTEIFRGISEFVEA